MAKEEVDVDGNDFIAKDSVYYRGWPVYREDAFLETMEKYCWSIADLNRADYRTMEKFWQRRREGTT